MPQKFRRRQCKLSGKFQPVPRNRSWFCFNDAESLANDHAHKSWFCFSHAEGVG